VTSEDEAARSDEQGDTVARMVVPQLRPHRPGKRRMLLLQQVEELRRGAAIAGQDLFESIPPSDPEDHERERIKRVARGLRLDRATRTKSS
jgi:hypothetical protein